ncbi:bifunctional enoyl-CoA hydratase/phosphate acetyltransferase [Anaerotignum sp.]|uniref:bifunctional enoyl-CoA hydratase/phosphate acetyltransferase n=1 Tax=Anaerotignum sp. TaxID=2039241 RepID=UPI0027149863|nr:bifunctional enoyl-CoA hydratase/phosphate acetyltransferase [Anaerotignum sp.]
MEQIRNFDELIAKAKAKEITGIAVVCPHDADTISAVKDGIESGLVKPELFGDSDKIKPLLKEAGISENSVSIVDVKDTEGSVKRAIESIKNGYNKVIMKGTISTPDVMKPVMDKANGLNSGTMLSHVIVCDIPGFGRLLLSTDGAINIAPNLNEKAAIVKNAINVAQKLGVAAPKVAILAAIENVNVKMQATVDAACLSKMADRGVFKNAIVDGPLSIDNIISAASAKKKGIKSEVAGAADIIVSPSIEVANVFAKTLNYMAASTNAGIVVGAKAPIILPSRASSEKSKWASLALGVLIAD